MRIARTAALVASVLAAVQLAHAQQPAEPVKAEVFAELPQAVGNITFTPDKRVIFSHHPFFAPDIRVAELNPDRKSFKPFPDASWNTPRPGTDRYLDSVLGLRGDENGIVWLMDMGQRTPLTPKLVGWDAKRNRLHRIYYIPAPASLPESQHNDFVVDLKNRKFYIADEGIGPSGDGSKAALVIVDMETGAARRVLQGHASTQPENRPITVEGKDLTVPGKDGQPMMIKVGADGIAADKEFRWLYFAPLNGTSVYRLRIADLNNERLGETELGAKVERYAAKPNNGGFSLDAKGNLYLTEVEAKAVGVIPADGRQYRRFAVGEAMHWPDGISYSPDGFMYVSAAQLAQASVFNDGKGLNKAPYYIFRFKPLAPGRIGH
ncbi:L-dopachrome tautomerase-related protein [Bosea sp. NPDC003192]|jgi:sugar lactone lactonase YvrE|uniref:L-dopachrome tautomerase-related protein n=1 Tax=Bosea sp. NPDC003192 TaxID=3390551 RepID=UPI003CFDD837